MYISCSSPPVTRRCMARNGHCTSRFSLPYYFAVPTVVGLQQRDTGYFCRCGTAIFPFSHFATCRHPRLIFIGLPCVFIPPLLLCSWCANSAVCSSTYQIYTYLFIYFFFYLNQSRAWRASRACRPPSTLSTVSLQNLEFVAGQGAVLLCRSVRLRSVHVWSVYIGACTQVVTLWLRCVFMCAGSVEASIGLWRKDALSRTCVA